MNAMAKRRSEWTEDELDEMLASAGRGVEAISRSERFAFGNESVRFLSPSDRFLKVCFWDFF